MATVHLSLSSSYLLGIDGGGTKTAFALTDANGTVLATLRLGASNPNAVGLENAKKILSQGILSLCASLPSSTSVVALFAGISGCMTGDYGVQLQTYLRTLLPKAKITVTGDIPNVIASADGTERCCAGILGTGSVFYAVNGDELHRAGGWGYLLDGAGSGYDIGRDALQACLRTDDGLCAPSPLTEAVERHLGGTVLSKLGSFYTGSRDTIASFAPFVFTAAAQNDKTAVAILQRNFAHVHTLISHLQATYDCSNRILLAGGLTKQTALIQRYLFDLFPVGTEFILPKAPPVYGACRRARRLVNYENTPAVSNRLLSGLQSPEE